MNVIRTSWTYPTHIAGYEVNFILDPEGEDDGYIASCKELAGVLSQGDTASEALENIKDAFCLVVKSYQDDGKTIPWR